MFAQRTVFGQQIYAIGANPVAARLSGIPVEPPPHARLHPERRHGGTGLAGLSGAGQFGRRDIGEDLTLPTIAAVLIGGTSLFGGSAPFGHVVWRYDSDLGHQRHEPVGVQRNWQPFVTGAIVLFAVLIDILTRAHTEGRR